MDDEDDVPDELWSMLDTISHEKNHTVSQATNLFQHQQQQQQRAPALPTSIAGGTTTTQQQQQQQQQWRPHLVQQAPSAAPPKPKSLAQQLLGDGNSSLSGRHGSTFGTTTGTTGASTTTQQRWPPAPQGPLQPWGASASSMSLTGSTQRPPQQQQQWTGQQQSAPGAGQANGATAGRGSAAAMLAAGIGLPPLANSSMASAGAAAPTATSPAPGANTMRAEPAQQQQVQLDAAPDVQKLQQELQQHMAVANQLRNQLAAAQQEKQQLHHEKQQLQHRLTSSSQHSMAQHRAQDLQRQVSTYQERLRFAEEEARLAEAASAAKAARATQAEAQLKQLQDEVRRKEDVLQQLQVELEQEKQRTARLAANPAAVAAAAAPGQAVGTSSSSLQQHLAGFASPPGPSPLAGALGGAAAAAGVGSSGRKRKGPAGAAAANVGTPAASMSGKAAAARQLTPQQQVHQHQMARLLGAGPASVSFDIDVYDDLEDDPQQQQQASTGQHADNAPAAQTPALAVANAATPAAATPSHSHQQQQQPEQNQQAAEQQQQHQEAPIQQQAMGAAAAAAEPQPPPSLSSSFANKLVPALQRVQIKASPTLPQLLWRACQPAMQQLLQPLSSQVVGLSSMLASVAGATPTPEGTPTTSNLSQLVPTALSAAQEQLSLLTAGVVSTGCALLVGLLQLAAVVIPEGPVAAGSSEANSSGEVEGMTLAAAAAAATATAAMQAAFPASGDQAPKWLLLPVQQQQSEPDTAGLCSSAAQQAAGQFVVFRSALDPNALHILPLNLAVAVLQLLQHLVCYDPSCLHALVAELSSAEHHGSSDLDHHQQQHSTARPEQTSSNALHSLQANRGGVDYTTSSRVQIDWTSGPAQDSPPAMQFQRQRQAWRSSCQAGVNSMLAAGHSCLPGVSSSWQAPLGATHDDANGGGSSGGGWQQQQQQQHRSLALLLLDAARCHSALLPHVGALLAAVAAQLPVDMQPLLLTPVMSEHSMLLLLLQADKCGSRCAAAALLQRLLSSPAVAAAMADALAAALSEQQQQQNQEDVIMIDVAEGQQGTSTALQPLNHRSVAAARASTCGSSRQGKVAQQQQQQQQPGAAAAAQGHSAPALQQQPVVLLQPVVQDVVLQMLDCFSFGLEETFLDLQAIPSPGQHGSSLPAHPASGSGSSSSSSGCGGAVGREGRGWGAFELQRRCCAVMAGVLHSHQDALLLYSMDQQVSAGCGLAQRLLVMVDAACSPVGGDPFAALTPEATGPTAAAAARPAASSSTVCGSSCSWHACLERVRLAHEGLLLLRALVATPGAVGTAAMADLSSNSTSLRLIMTTRAKLTEVITGLTAAAAAAAAAGNSGTSTAASPTPAAAAAAGVQAADGGTGSMLPSSAAAVTALPLQPWAWPWSAQCGCNSSSSSSNKGSNSSSVEPGQQVLHAQRPPLHAVLQEMSNTAASIHRRVMIYLRGLETAMQS